MYTIDYMCVIKSLDLLQIGGVGGHISYPMYWRYQWCVCLWPCSQKVPECCSPWNFSWSFSWRCGYSPPHHTSTLSLARLQGHKVIGVAMAASIPELGTLGSARVIEEPDLPSLTGALITGQGAHMASGWGSGWWVLWIKEGEKSSEYIDYILCSADKLTVIVRNWCCRGKGYLSFSC